MQYSERVGPTEADTAREDKMGAASWLAGLLMFVYPLGVLFPFVYKNISVGDVFLIGAFFVGILRFQRSYLSLLASGYGVIAFSVMFSTGASILIMGQSLKAMDAMAQFATIVWLLLPLVAIGIAEMKRPLRYLEAGGWVYFAVVVAGAFLLFALGSELIFQNSGANRYFVAIPMIAFESCLVPLVLVGLFALRKFVSWEGLRLLMLLAAAVVAAVLADSRTSIVVALSTALLALGINRRPMVALLVGSILSIGYVFIRESEWLGDMFGVGHRELFRDSDRQDLMMTALDSIGANMQQFFFGAGWQGSGFVTSESAVIVHNTYLQVTVEWGLFGLVGWLGIWILPWTWLLRSRRNKSPEWQVALLTLFSVQLGWMFHPIATTRPHWLGFAVGMGLAYRVYLQSRNGTEPPGRGRRQHLPGGPRHFAAPDGANYLPGKRPVRR